MNVFISRVTLGEGDSWGVRANLPAPHLPGQRSRREECTTWAQEHQIHFMKPCPADTKAPGTAARGVLRAKAAGPSEAQPRGRELADRGSSRSAGPSQKPCLLLSNAQQRPGLPSPHAHGLECPSTGRFTSYLQK